MDDKNFDLKTAEEWISIIESDTGVRVRDTYPLLVDWIRRHEPEKVADIGCGQGVCSEQISSEISYTGLDPSPYLLARANEKYAHRARKFILGSVYQMPLPDSEFDAAFSISVWHLLSDIGTAASELARILKPDGHFMIIMANPLNYDAWKHHLEKDVLHFHAYDDLVHSLESAGLRITVKTTFRPNQERDLYMAISGSKVRA